MIKFQHSQQRVARRQLGQKASANHPRPEREISTHTAASVSVGMDVQETGEMRGDARLQWYLVKSCHLVDQCRFPNRRRHRLHVAVAHAGTVSNCAEKAAEGEKREAQITGETAAEITRMHTRMERSTGEHCPSDRAGGGCSPKAKQRGGGGLKEVDRRWVGERGSACVIITSSLGARAVQMRPIRSLSLAPAIRAASRAILAAAAASGGTRQCMRAAG